MSYSTQSEVFLGEVEVTYNTDPTPTDAANAIEVFQPSWNFEGLSFIQRRPVRNQVNLQQGIFAGTLRKISGMIEITGSGTAGTTPRWAPILRACGMTLVNTPATSDVFTTAEPANHNSATFYLFEGGKRYIVTGCRGTGRFVMPARDRLMFEFEMVGHSSEPTDVAVSTLTPVYDDIVPNPVIGLTGLDMGGFSTGLEINTLNLDLGNALTLSGSIRATDGYGEIIIPERDMQGSFDPEATNKATNDWENDFKSGTLLALDTGTVGGTAGNRWRLQATDCYYRNMTPADRDSVRTYDMPFGVKTSVVLTIT